MWEIGTDGRGLAIRLRSGAKIAPGLRLVSFGHELFETGGRVRLWESRQTGRQCDGDEGPHYQYSFIPNWTSRGGMVFVIVPNPREPKNVFGV